MPKGAKQRRSVCLGGFLIAISIGSTVSAQALVADTVTPVSASELSAIVDGIAARMRSTYVDSATGQAMADTIVRRQGRGAYASIRAPLAMADSITAELRSVSHDEHVRVRYRPFGTVVPATIDDSAARAKRRELYLRDVKWDNYGFDEVRAYPASVGYLRFHEFTDPRYAGAKLASAMDYLRDSRALIIDLRGNYGGYEGLIQQIMGYFLRVPTLLWTATDRLTQTSRQAWSVASVPGGPIDPSIPVYILTSSRTFSAAEMLADVMKASGRGMIVGERTRGGGNSGDFYTLNARFDVFVPHGSATNAFTGKSYEKTGVMPNIAVSADSALLVARRMALESVRKSVTDAELLTEVDAAIKALEKEAREGSR